MKFILTALITLTSFASFAQAPIDLVLKYSKSEGVSGSIDRTRIRHFAKLEVTKEMFDFTLKPNMLIRCNTGRDRNAALFISNGELVAIYGLARNTAQTCTGIGCRTGGRFETLAEVKSRASNMHEIIIDRERNSITSVSIESMASFINDPDRTKPSLESLGYITLFDPAVHEPNRIPGTNSFFCFAWNGKTNTPVSIK